MSWMSGLRRKFKFSAERLSENAKTISLSHWKLIMLQCFTNKGQKVLKSIAKKGQNIWLTCSCIQIFWHFLSNGAFLDFLLIYALLKQNLYVEIYALFPQNFCDWKADSANYFAFRMYGAWCQIIFDATLDDCNVQGQMKSNV